MFALVGFLLFCWLLPETKGQTLEDVELLFSRSPCPSLPFFRRRDSVNPNSAKSVQYVQIRGLNRDHKQLEEEED